MAGQPTIAANAPTAQPNELAMLMQGYSPQTAVAAQRSQYLAQALAGMRQQSQDIRTPVALGSDLLAQALLQRKYGQSMSDLSSAVAAQRQARATSIFGDGSVPGSLPQAPASAPPAASPTPDASAPPPPPAPPTTQNATPAPSPVVLRTVLGEAGGNPEGQKAVYASILKRAQESGLTPEQVVTAPGQYEGLHAPWLAKVSDNHPMFAQTAANLAGVQPGQFDSFYSPSGQAALGRQPPAWAKGPGVNVGGNSFYETGYQAPPGMRGAPSGQAPYAPQGQPGPLQVSNAPQGTPTPSPSPGAASPAPGGTASPAPAATSPAAGAGSAPASAGGLPSMPATLYAPVDPKQWAYARQLAANPDPVIAQQGMELGQKLRDQSVSPIEPKIEQVTGGTKYIDPYGRFADRFVATQGQPVDTKNMMALGPNGYTPVGGPRPDNLIAGLASTRKDFIEGKANEDYRNAAEALNSLNDMFGKSTGNNGVIDMSALDNLVRAQTGLSARQGGVQMMMSHFGLPQEIMGHFSNLIGQGAITPQILGQMRAALRSYAEQKGRIAQQELGSANAFAKKQGYGDDIGYSIAGLNPDANVSWMPPPQSAPAPQPPGPRPGHSDASEFQ